MEVYAAFQGFHLKCGFLFLYVRSQLLINHLQTSILSPDLPPAFPLITSQLLNGKADVTCDQNVHILPGTLFNHFTACIIGPFLLNAN